jgi:manganese transport protein
MEGFLRFRMQPWLRRAVTRFIAITPAALTVYFAGETGSYKLIILSQIIISFQLPFAVIPLVHFTSDRKRMGEFANGLWLQIASWVCAAVVLILNVWLVSYLVRDLVSASGRYRPLVVSTLTLAAVGCLVLLFTITCWPWFYRLGLRRAPLHAERVAVTVPERTAPVFPSRTYSSILVPLDHSEADHEALGNALALARMHDSRIILMHVEEGVTSQMFGSLSSTAEITEGQDYLAHIVSSLRNQGVEVDVVVRHGNNPAKQIADAVEEVHPDLVIMASHGHRGLKDLIFGTTINSVRHRVKVPLLIVRHP